MLMGLLAAGWLLAACESLDPATPGALVPKTVDQDASLPAIDVNGTRFHAETFGNPTDPLLILLHGGPGSDYRYLLNAKAFAQQGYFVVFYDQRGSGLSKRHDRASYTLDTMQEDLDAVIAYYKKAATQKVFLLGHSWGAMLATAYIDGYPGKINGVILAEPGGFTYPDMTAYVNRSRAFKIASETFGDALYPDQFFTGRENDHALLDYRAGLINSTDGAVDSPIGNEGPLPGWRSGAVVFDALFKLADNRGFNWTRSLGQFKTKVLFLYSANNRAYGLEHARLVSSAYPSVEMVRIADAGHDMLSFPKGWANSYPTMLTYLNTLNAR